MDMVVSLFEAYDLDVWEWENHDVAYYLQHMEDIPLESGSNNSISTVELEELVYNLRKTFKRKKLKSDDYIINEIIEILDERGLLEEMRWSVFDAAYDLAAEIIINRKSVCEALSEVFGVDFCS